MDQGKIQPMMFGLNRTTDEQSLKKLLELLAQRQVTAALVPRMQDDEIHQLADQVMTLVKKHLSHQEYHQLLLGDDDEH